MKQLYAHDDDNVRFQIFVFFPFYSCFLSLFWLLFKRIPTHSLLSPCMYVCVCVWVFFFLNSISLQFRLVVYKPLKLELNFQERLSIGLNSIDLSVHFFSRCLCFIGCSNIRGISFLSLAFILLVCGLAYFLCFSKTTAARH